MRRILGMATAATFVVVMANGATAQVLTSVPDNAAVFIRVKNLESASKKIGALMQEWGIAGMQPALADPLAALEGMGNIQQGLNRGGEAALVFFNPMAVAQQGDPYVIMLPVSDYPAFLKNFQGAAPEGDLTEITLPMNGDTAYVAKWGAYAAISPNKQLVAARPQASKVTGLTGKQLADRDVTAYVNFNGFRDQVSGYLGIGRMMAVGQMDQNPNVTPEQAKLMPMAKAAFNQVFNGFEHFINETQAITVGMDFNDDGVQLTMMSEFMPDSYLGKFASQWKSPETTLGAGLPEGQYALIGTSAFDSATLLQLVDDAAGPVLVEAEKLGAQGKPVLEYVQAIKDFWKATKVQQFALSPGKGKAGETALFEMIMTMQGDTKGIMESQNRMAQSQQEFTKLVQMQGQPTSAIEMKKAAKVVDGVSFDEMVTTFEQGAGGNMQGMQMMDAIYGKGGFKMLLGSVDDKTVIVTTSSDEAFLHTAIEAAKSNKTAVAEQAHTKQVASKLPGNPLFSFFVYGDQFMGIVSRASEAFAGTPIQTTLPAGTPPLGMAMSTEGSAVRMDYFIPSPLVKAVTGAAMQEMVKKQQQQNRGGGL